MQIQLVTNDYNFLHIGHLKISTINLFERNLIDYNLDYKTDIQSVDKFNQYVLNFICNNRNCDLFKSDKLFTFQDLKCVFIGIINYEENTAYLFVQKSNSKTRLLCYIDRISKESQILNEPKIFQQIISQKLNVVLKDDFIMSSLKSLNINITNIDDLIFGI
jgi:hypothetical protein